MTLLGNKDGKLWWNHVMPNGSLKSFTEEEMVEWRKEEREIIDSIAADVYNKHFGNPK